MLEDSNRFDCLIVGAGMAGIAAARELDEAGFSVCLLDKSRGIGGRLATRRIDGERFDHGAQFFTVRDTHFRMTVDSWLDSKVVRPWFGSPGHIRYCGTVDMNSVVKDFAGDLEIRRQQKVVEIDYCEDVWTVRSETDSFQASRLLMTCPAPQALTLLESSRTAASEAFVKTLGKIEYDKCIALMLLLKAESGLEAPGMLQLEPNEPLATVTETMLKGTTSRPGIVIQSGPQFADAHFSASSEELYRKMTEALPIEGELQVEGMSVQKWRFAKRRDHNLSQSFSEESALGLWHAGDGYIAPKVEGAFQSGREVGAAIAKSLASPVGKAAADGGENFDAE